MDGLGSSLEELLDLDLPEEGEIEIQTEGKELEWGIPLEVAGC